MPLKENSTQNLQSLSFDHSKMTEFKYFRWMQNLNQPTWDHGILYFDRSSNDEQL